MALSSIVKNSLAFSTIRRCLKSKRYVSWTVSCFSRHQAEDMRTQGASNCYLQVVGSGPPHCPPSLFLYSDFADCRYLINCGEGTQRMMMEHGMWLSKVESVFLTSLSWNSIGGVVGLTLTLRDIGTSKKVTYYGPPGLSVIMSAVKIFAQLDGINIVCKSYEELALKDDVMSVQAVPIHGKQGEESGSDQSEGSETFLLENVIQGMKVEHSTSFGSPKPKRRKLSEIVEADTSVAYIFKMNDKPGNIVVEKAVALGLPPGPAYSELKKGNSVKTQDGKEIFPSDVLTPKIPGPIFIVMECPSEDFMDSLENSAELCQFQQEDIEKPVALIVHITPTKVFNTTRYQTWMKRFGKKTDHMIMNEDAESHGLLKSMINQAKLNMVHPDIFPNLKVNFPISQGKPETEGEDGATKFAECLLKYSLRPLGKWDRSSVPVLAREDLEKEVHSIEGFTQHLQEFKQSVNSIGQEDKTATACESESGADGVAKETASADNVTTDTAANENRDSLMKVEHADQILETDRTEKSKLSDCCVKGQSDLLNSGISKSQQSGAISVLYQCPYPKVIFLGTGSALPSNTRNVSSILLLTSESAAVLLDCGEGTLGQLYRHYGNQTVDVLTRLQCIYVSHLHADHHMGLINLLLERQKIAEVSGINLKPLNLVVPTKLITWLNKYNREFQPILQNSRFIPCKTLLRVGTESSEEINKMHTQLQLSKMETVVVNHFSQPHGVALTHQDGWKIVYSGDTMPCHGLIDIGRDADILIHEGTFEEGLEEEALEKRHSTIPQAVDISRKMNAASCC
ncbi:zinc phosphodiesterase ELAC protein 2-like [Ptychodera flava]|uniref:zinc phosphodiesterase ELAC protein 2-like n=1 Tax=Ptychodera flava TaxID=63121 RepID=UPI00396A3066